MNGEIRGLRIGIDVGSTTLKAVVVVPETGEIVWQDYRRHESRQAGMLLEFLGRMETEAGIRPGGCRLFVTGSGGSALAELIGARFVQEVHAVALAVERLHPEVRSVIELGGQDAKIIVFKKDDQRGCTRKIPSMNDKCAGGTGAVIDKISAKLNLSPQQLQQQRYSGLRLHRVAGKCGVFAETDINSLQKQGIPPDELMASLFDAIVLQNLTVLARGHTLHPHVLLLGGPNSFIPGMREAWQHNIATLWAERGVDIPEWIKPEDLICTPRNAEYFAAIGAVEFGRSEPETMGLYQGTLRLQAHLQGGRRLQRSKCDLPGLVRSQEELEAFRSAYVRPPFVPASVAAGATVRAFAGVDGGSTSTKAVLLSESGEVLCKSYQLSRGNPIEDTIEMFEQLRRQVEAPGARLEVLGVGTTGYAKDILRDVLQADVALVETVAHTQSALKFYPGSDVIVDVGGQDIKLILLRDGRVKDFKLNTQCSAGNGYFLQATAEGFGLTVDEYADAAFSAPAMPLFGYGCAVFMQSDIVNFQRQGWKAPEILAGLAAVLPKNIWLYVAKIPNLTDLGSRFILQGGTQNNLAAVKAQVDFIRARFRGSGREPELIVHRHCGEAGAIGAAVEAMRLWQNGRKSSFIGLDAVRSIRFRTTRSEATRCYFCKNQCVRTFIDIHTDREGCAANLSTQSKVPLQPGEQRLIVATCEKGTVEDVNRMRAIKAGLDAIKDENPNLVEFAAREVWKPPAAKPAADSIPARGWTPAARRRIRLMKGRGQLRVGMPRVLNLYWYAPLFSAYLQSLGVAAGNIVYSDYTSEEMYRAGAKRGSIDPCFPSKVAIAHIHNLIYVKHRRKPLDCIFFPMFDVLQSPLVNILGSNACPTTTATPEAVKAAFTKEVDVFAGNGIRYLNPLLNLASSALLGRQMFEAWEEVLALSRRENERAIAAGYHALRQFESEIRKRARVLLDTLERERRLGIVVLGRPYHHDPGIHHSILEELQKRGYPILSQSTLPLEPDLLDRLFGDEVAGGLIADPLDISDVWKNTVSASSSHKIWAAKFTARHPWLIALELSSFKCGHDAPIYTVIEQIVERSGTPYFAFKDIDENKPAGSIKIRVETIDYFLTRYRENLLGKGKEAIQAGSPENRPAQTDRMQIARCLSLLPGEGGEIPARATR